MHKKLSRMKARMKHLCVLLMSMFENGLQMSIFDY
jgi:hypothetical protein